MTMRPAAFLLLCLLSPASRAQHLIVRLANGSTLSYPIANVRSTDFEDGAMRVHLWSGGMYSHSMASMISNQFSTVSAPVVRIAARVVLEGPYSTATGLMADAMRVGELLPLQEPYTMLGYFSSGPGGGEATTEGVLAITGNDAIVDWVVVELRDVSAPGTRIAARCALLQRDGDVVDVDGISPVTFGTAPGDYHVAVRHRNHLGVMSAAPLALGEDVLSVDFAGGGTPVYGTAARKAIGTVQALWAGDATANGQVKYTGSGNDRDPVLTTVGSTAPNNTVTAYSTRDTNLNGQIKYTGTGNDRDIILLNVGSTTPNGTRSQQLP